MFSLQPIAFVHNERINVEDDLWGEIESVIELADLYTEESL